MWREKQFLSKDVTKIISVPEFLQEVFYSLTLKEVRECRLVCSEWRAFIDQYNTLTHFVFAYRVPKDLSWPNIRWFSI